MPTLQHSVNNNSHINWVWMDFGLKLRCGLSKSIWLWLIQQNVSRMDIRWVVEQLLKLIPKHQKHWI